MELAGMYLSLRAEGMANTLSWLFVESATSSVLSVNQIGLNTLVDLPRPLPMRSC